MAKFEGYERREAKILAALKEYGINSIDECKEICDSYGIDPYLVADLLTFVDRGDSIIFQASEYLCLTSCVTFKLCHYVYLLDYSLRGSMYFAASANLPYVPLDFSYASLGSMPFLMKSVILPRDTNSYPIT